MPKVSVIIPTYNREKYLPEAIDSVLNQTFQDFELIIVDDGSTDNTKEILKPYLSKIRYIYQKNKGPSAARNTGIRYSTGEWIAFLDADDIWLLYKLKLQVKYLEEHPDIALVYADLGVFNEKGVIEKNHYLSRKISRPTGYIFQELVMRPLISTITVMVRKSIFDTVGLFSEDLLIGEDYELWLRIAKNYKIGYLPKVVAMYRIHKLSIIQGDFNILQGIPGEIKVVEKMLNRYPEEKRKLNRFKYRRRLSRPYFGIGYRYFHKKQYKIARKYFQKCIEICPFNFTYLKYYLICCLSPKTIFRLMQWKELFEKPKRIQITKLQDKSK